jgi:hypothetical protein
VRLGALVWLRGLDDCPRVPIDPYPLKGTAIWVSLSELDFLEEPLLAIDYRKLIPPTWLLTIAKDKLPDEMIKDRPQVVDQVTPDQRPSARDAWRRFDLDYMPVPVTPYIDQAAVGVLFRESVNFRFQSAQVLFGPPELEAHTREICDRGHAGLSSSDG